MTKNIELLDIIKSLRNYDINNQDISYNETMLMAYASKLEVAKYLLSKRANVDLQNMSDATALHNATLTHSFNVMELLLENGTNTKIKNNYNKTCIDYMANIVNKMINTKYISKDLL